MPREKRRETKRESNLLQCTGALAGHQFSMARAIYRRVRAREHAVIRFETLIFAFRARVILRQRARARAIRISRARTHPTHTDTRARALACPLPFLHDIIRVLLPVRTRV